jgi:citrate/tricarballylate utilization protein
MTRQKAFADGDITHLANLCHNCRGCYYACQYTEPHEFALNLPAALAEVRVESWERLILAPAWRGCSRPTASPWRAAGGGAGRFFWALAALRPDSGDGFYAYLAHNTMVAIFLPAFIAPLALIALSLRGLLARGWGANATPVAHRRRR